MSSPEGSMPNIDLGKGRSSAKKLFRGRQKLNLPRSPADAFGTFIDEGNIFGTQKKKQRERFIPTSPAGGIEKTFDADSFAPSSIKTGKRIRSLFKFGI